MQCSSDCYTSPKIRKNLKELKNTPPVKYSAWPISPQGIYDCIGAIIGPENTPYENGIFYVKISLPSHNHGSLADIKFLTKIYHPNINAQGKISSHVLRLSGNDLKLILEMLYSILKYPDWKHIENIEARDYYKGNIDEFNKIATEWTRLYAS